MKISSIVALAAVAGAQSAASAPALCTLPRNSPCSTNDSCASGCCAVLAQSTKCVDPSIAVFAQFCPLNNPCGGKAGSSQQTYPSWCDDIAEKDKIYVSACGGDGKGADGMPAWCGSLDAKSKGCIAQCGGTFTPSCCDGMDAATRQYVVGCNGEDWGSVGGGGGGGGGGEGGGGGDGGGGGTSNAVMSQGRIIVGASLISSALTTWMLL